MRFFLDLLTSDEGATTVEYAVMLMLILLAVYSAIVSFGKENGGMWGGIENDMKDAGFVK